MLYAVNRASADVLNKIAAAPRLDNIAFDWTSGWNETTDRKLGFFESGSLVSTVWEDVILQGPHITVATPLYQQPNQNPKSRQDTEALALDTVPEDFIPRTSYQVARPYDEYIAAYPKWQDKSSSSYFRLAWREMCDSATVRTLHSAILPPGPTHVLGIYSFRLRNSAIEQAILAGVSHSIVADFFVKVIGIGHVRPSFWKQLPLPRNHPLHSELIFRTLRLNCLVRPYAPLWEELYSPAWQHDSWVPGVGTDYSGREPLGAIGPKWEWSTPLRRDADRRQALIEIDAIVAVMLGITAEELLTIYRTQFPVLQKYERDALYDVTGRQLPTKLASEYRKKGALKPADLTVDGVTYQEPFTGVNRERDMELAHTHFSALLKDSEASNPGELAK